MPLIPLLLLTVFVSTAGAASGSGEEALAAAAERQAQGGDVQAMVELGRIYLNGAGRPRDYDHAMEWFLKAAKEGNAAGQVGVGFLFSRGLGCPLDKKKAGEWFRRAAEQNDAKGQYNLALLMNQGWLGPDQLRESLSWFKKAADQGLVVAQATLGNMYYCSAEGVGQDFTQAAYWLEKAAAGGDNPSRTTFASMLRYGNAVDVDKTKAYGLFLAASRDGHAKAMCQLADMLAAGEGVPKQPVLAGAWYLKAASLDETAGKDRWELLKKTLTSDQIAAAESEMAKLVVETKGS